MVRPSQLALPAVKTVAARRLRVTFAARLVAAPISFQYRLFTEQSNTPIPMNGLTTGTWTTFQSYIGSPNSNVGISIEQQRVPTDPITYQPILPTQRGAIALANIIVEDCGPTNPGCQVASNGASVCGVAFEQLPAGYSYVKNIRTSEYLTTVPSHRSKIPPLRNNSGRSLERERTNTSVWRTRTKTVSRSNPGR